LFFLRKGFSTQFPLLAKLTCFNPHEMKENLFWFSLQCYSTFIAGLYHVKKSLCSYLSKKTMGLKNHEKGFFGTKEDIFRFPLPPFMPNFRCNVHPMDAVVVTHRGGDVVFVGMEMDPEIRNMDRFRMEKWVRSYH